MRVKVIACVVGLMMLAGCAAFPAESPYPSPGSLTPSTTVASQGSVFFVSATEAWELTQPPDHLRTVVLRTTDAGAHWKIWGIAPEAGGPLGFSTTEVVLSTTEDILRSSDGAHWTTKRLPTFGTPMLLPDLRHGWVGGFPIFFAAPSPSPTVPSGKGAPPPGGKGGGGGSPPAGKGGGTAAAPPPTCQDEGCAPI